MMPVPVLVIAYLSGIIDITVDVFGRKNPERYWHANIQNKCLQKKLGELLTVLHLNHVMKKPTFCICENKDADQLRGNREADQRLCFRYIDSTIPLLSKSEISSL